MSNVIEQHPLHKSMSVLVVEDEKRLRELLVDAIPDMGFAATGARSGEEALACMEAAPHDIVILDLNLPQMHGLDVLERIRQRWPLTRAIVMTAFGDLAAAQRAIHLEVVEFLTKPCPLGEIERALDHARSDRLARAMSFSSRDSHAGDGPTLDATERNAIRAALQRSGGNRKAAAYELGISRRTLHYRLSRYRAQGLPLD